MTYSRVHTAGRQIRSAAEQLVYETLEIRPGETVLISNDVDGDPELAAVLREAVQDAGASPILIVTPRISHPGAELPRVLCEAGKASDVWIELNQMYVEGTAAHIEAQAAGLRRFYSLTGMDASDLVAMTDIDSDVVKRFGDRLAALTASYRTMHVTCANGTDFTAGFDATNIEHDTLLMPLGQTHVYPEPSTCRGRFVFDAWAFPPRTVGVLQHPVTTTFDADGRATVVDDCAAANAIIDWANDVNDEDLQWVCHVSYGFHPNVLRAHGRLVRDERIFGSLCVGFGTKMPYTSHLDFGLSRPTVTLDDYLLQREGRYLDSELMVLARSLGVPGYE